MAKQKGGDVRIGISGWRYPPWRGVFYPPDLPQRRELEYASRQLRTIEINGSFYSLQTPGSYQAWHDETPADFLFSVKGGRYITTRNRSSSVSQHASTAGQMEWSRPMRGGFRRCRLRSSRTRRRLLFRQHRQDRSAAQRATFA